MLTGIHLLILKVFKSLQVGNGRILNFEVRALPIQLFFIVVSALSAEPVGSEFTTDPTVDRYGLIPGPDSVVIHNSIINDDPNCSKLLKQSYIFDFNFSVVAATTESMLCNTGRILESGR
jgi:hypothetical protein